MLVSPEVDVGDSVEVGERGFSCDEAARFLGRELLSLSILAPMKDCLVRLEVMALVVCCREK